MSNRGQMPTILGKLEAMDLSLVTCCHGVDQDAIVQIQNVNIRGPARCGHGQLATRKYGHGNDFVLEQLVLDRFYLSLAVDVEYNDPAIVAAED